MLRCSVAERHGCTSFFAPTFALAKDNRLFMFKMNRSGPYRRWSGLLDSR